MAQFSSCCPIALRFRFEENAKVFDCLRIVRPLQTTQSCSVSLCIVLPGNDDDGPLCVVKTYHKQRLDAYELNQVTREVQLHQQLATDHVVPFWAAVDEGHQLHIIMQYASEGDLRSTLRQEDGSLQEACVRDQVVIPLLQALVELHAKGYVHRDIKPDNIFMTGNSAMLGDFSLAVGPLPSLNSSSSSSNSSTCSLPTSPAQADTLSTTCFCRCSHDSSRSLEPSSSDSMPDSDTAAGADSTDAELVAAPVVLSSVGSSMLLSSSPAAAGGCQAGGTPAYCAPEVITAAFNSLSMADVLGPQNDVWSLGMVAAECLMGEHPYRDAAAASVAVLASVISSSQPLPLSQLPVSPQCKDWLASALTKDPRQRWSAERLLTHAWITQGAATAADGAAAGTAADAWPHRLDVQEKQQQTQQSRGLEVSPASHRQMCRRGWVDDDWVSGLNSLLPKSGRKDEAAAAAGGAGVSADCSKQNQQQQCGMRGISSWED